MTETSPEHSELDCIFRGIVIPPESVEVKIGTGWLEMHWHDGNIAGAVKNRIPCQPFHRFGKGLFDERSYEEFDQGKAIAVRSDRSPSGRQSCGEVVRLMCWVSSPGPHFQSSGPIASVVPP